mgnify:CR=1 FL=1
MSAQGTYRFYSVWRQTILIVNGEPLGRERVNAFTVSFANCECINVRINYTGAHQQFRHVNLSVSNKKKIKELSIMFSQVRHLQMSQNVKLAAD